MPMPGHSLDQAAERHRRRGRGAGRDDGAGEARDDRLAAVVGERNPVDFRELPQHLELDASDRDHVDQRDGDQARGAGPQ